MAVFMGDLDSVWRVCVWVYVHACVYIYIQVAFLSSLFLSAAAMDTTRCVLVCVCACLCLRTSFESGAVENQLSDSNDGRRWLRTAMVMA